MSFVASSKTLLPVRVLVVGEPQVVWALSQQSPATSFSYETSLAASIWKALEQLVATPADVLLANFKSLGIGLRELLEKVDRRSPRTKVLILTNTARLPPVPPFMQDQCHFLTLPFDIEEFERAIGNLLCPAHPGRGVEEMPAGIIPPNSRSVELVSTAPCMKDLCETVLKVANSRVPVLIMGETGTGKEVVARAIHRASPRCDKPFFPIDCGGLAPTLIETELFGHVRGAFTGAVQNQPGLLAAAEDGTVFLDEIGEMPLNLQVKLLRALQEHEFRPVGSTGAMKFRARILAATNRDLEAAVQQGTFRQDLYFRLNVLTLRIPPLRERREDIPLLADHFLKKFAPTPEQPPLLPEKALRCLMEYDWPGNVRELENCIHHAVTLCTKPVLTVSDFPASLRNRSWCSTQPFCGKSVVPLQELEREAILQAIAAAQGDKKRAALMLGIGVTTLYRKLKEYGHP